MTEVDELVKEKANREVREALRQQAEKFTEELRKDCCKRCGNEHPDEGRLYECQMCGAILCRKQIVVQDATGVLFHEIDRAVVDREGRNAAAWMNCYCGPCLRWKEQQSAKPRTVASMSRVEICREDRAVIYRTVVAVGQHWTIGMISDRDGAKVVVPDVPMTPVVIRPGEKVTISIESLRDESEES